MKFSENWLRTLVNPQLSSDQLAHALTMAGLEVEALESVGGELGGIVVAEVVSLEKHPNADRLNVCQVDAGQGERLTIVCGAPNVHAGARVPCALIGAQLPGGMTIGKVKMRGVESSGMLCSARELGLSEESSGLLLLPPDAPVGTPLRDYLDLNDKLFTLKLTPNRADCLSVLGVAREVAALTDAPLVPPAITPAPATMSEALPVTLDDPVACARYCGRVIRGLNPQAATPGWMVRRLERSGIRSKGVMVDVTNYVMLELGQPLHAFDRDRLTGGITVRQAAANEKLRLLNGQEVTLTPGMLVIADAAGPQALAGVMGGEASAVSDATRSVFLESAWFAPAAIAGRARQLALTSDAAYRFERGVDFELAPQALERATALLLEIAGGEAGPVTEVIGELPQRSPIRLRLARAQRVLGIALDDAQVQSVLRRLHLPYAGREGEYQVTPPSYRFDLAIEADLIEELARVIGYEAIPAVAPVSHLDMLPQSEAVRTPALVREAFAMRDYHEIISYSFVDADLDRDLSGGLAAVQVQNPIAAQMGVMRTTLLDGLLQSLVFNLNRKQERVRLFELGRCFLPEANGEIAQPQRAAAIAYGPVWPEQWGVVARPVDFYDVKGDVEALLWPLPLTFAATRHPALHPTRAAKILHDGREIGVIGVLHPKWQQKYGLPQPAVVFELAQEALLARRVPAFAEISRLPAVRRDLAVVVDEKLPVQALLDAVQSHLPVVVTEFALFDEYRGKGIEPGKKSLAFRVLMQDTQKTLTDAEVDAVVGQILSVLSNRFNAVLRT